MRFSSQSTVLCGCVMQLRVRVAREYRRRKRSPAVPATREKYHEAGNVLRRGKRSATREFRCRQEGCASRGNVGVVNGHRLRPATRERFCDTGNVLRHGKGSATREFRCRQGGCASRGNIDVVNGHRMCQRHGKSITTRETFCDAGIPVSPGRLRVAREYRRRERSPDVPATRESFCDGGCASRRTIDVVNSHHGCRRDV